MIEPCVEPGAYVPGGNRWNALPVDDVGALTPRLSVSVIIPTKDQPLVADVVEMLADQSYPDDLVEIIVVDDGSQRPLDPSDLSDRAAPRVRVVPHESAGFGAGAARRAGATVAQHDILAFVDSDLRVPFHYLEAHARWHHVCPCAVVIGEVRMLTDPEVPTSSLRDGAEVQWNAVEWVRRYLERTDLLREDHPDVWSVTTGASVSVRRTFYERFGGFAGLGIRGVEDIEFGYRGFAHGGVIVPEREGFGWHPPERFFDDPQRGSAAKARRVELLADRVPTRKTRPSSGHRIRTVPDVVVNAYVGAEPSLDTTAVLDAVDGFLVANRPTTELVLHGLEERSDLAVLLDGMHTDPRVRAARQVRPESALAPRVAFCDLEDLTRVRGVVAQHERSGGLVGLTHANRRPTVVVSGRALNRAFVARAGASGGWPGDEDFLLIDRLFGGEWVDASVPGDALLAVSPRASAGVEAALPDAGALDRIAELEAELQRLRVAHQRLRSRRVLQLTDKVGALRRRLVRPGSAGAGQ